MIPLCKFIEKDEPVKVQVFICCLYISIRSFDLRKAAESAITIYIWWQEFPASAQGSISDGNVNGEFQSMREYIYGKVAHISAVMKATSFREWQWQELVTMRKFPRGFR